MCRSLAKFRVLAVLLAAFLLSFGSIAGAAHASEEDIHHAMAHDGDDAGVSEDGDPVQGERTVHPEHASHCHSGACHFHSMAKNGDLQFIELQAIKLSPPVAFVPEQSAASSLFRPPRV